MNLDYYAKHGAALFPLPAGSKAPGSIAFWPDPKKPERAGSFLHNYSRDPLQWAAWMALRPGCNFGVVGFASHWIIIDIDTKTETNTPTPEEKAAAQAEAWQAWADLCTAWGFAEPFAPHVQSARGGWHCYFAIPDDVDPATLRQPDAVAKRINVRVRGYTVAAGSYYDGTAKGEESGYYTIYPNASPYPAPAALLEHCAPPKPRENVAKIGTHDFIDAKKLYEWMGDNRAITTDEEWRNAGMAAKLEFGDNGFVLWSILAEKLFNEPVDTQNETRWRSFGTEPTANAVTMDSIFALAHRAGWKGTVRPSAESMFSGVAQLASAPGIAPTAAASIGYDMSAAPAAATSKRKHLRRSGDFVRSFVPPDYLVDGILQRRFCYSLTAQTGVGKTTIAMLLAAHVAIGKPLGQIQVERGTVLYFAGENPTDVQMRWLGLCREMGLDPETVDVIFVEGTKRFSETAEEITQEIVDAGVTLSLVVVDTVAAFFEGDNDNDNVQMGNHARMLRSLTLLPGGPCVLVLAHPTKGAKALEEMAPRGGGAFLNEVDGNIGLVRDESGTLAASATGKFRGPEFPPINFALKVVRDHPLLVDTKGRQIPTIIAEPISSGEVARREEKTGNDGRKILKVLCDHSLMKNADVQKAMGYANHSTSKRALEKLESEGLATQVDGYWAATPKGQKHVNALASVQPADEYKPLTPSAGIPVPRMYTPPPLPPTSATI